jgi:ketol-acid reductoisomerase
MSRSRKKNPVTSNTVVNHGSMKKDKRRANKSLRKTTKNLLKGIQNGDFDEDDYVDMNVDDVSDSYSFKGDGKQWLDEDVEDYERYLRK